MYFVLYGAFSALLCLFILNLELLLTLECLNSVGLDIRYSSKITKFVLAIHDCFRLFLKFLMIPF